MSLFGRIEHLRYRRFLDAAVDGELTGDRARRVCDHVVTCPRCTRDEHTTILLKRRLQILRVFRPSALWHRPHDR